MSIFAFLFKKKKSGALTIEFNRSSVAAESDKDSHAVRFSYTESDTLYHYLSKHKDYMIRMSNTVWTISSGSKVLAYYVCGPDGKEEEDYLEFASRNMLISELPTKSIFCKYYFKGSENVFQRLPKDMPLVDQVKQLHNTL